MQGFIVFDYAKEYGTARAQLAQWLGEGKLKRKETIVKGGVAAAEEAFQQLFQGGNIGKRKTRPWIDTEKDQSRLTTEQASSWSRSRTQMRYRGSKGLSRSTRHFVQLTQVHVLPMVTSVFQVSQVRETCWTSSNWPLSSPDNNLRPSALLT
jgi:hypothetical protein